MHRSSAPCPLPPFPTRRSSDLVGPARRLGQHNGPHDRSEEKHAHNLEWQEIIAEHQHADGRAVADFRDRLRSRLRSEEHTSELQSRVDVVCRLLLEKKKNKNER